MNIDKFRQIHLSLAEALDAWRIIPRALVGLYCYMLYKIVVWYMELHPYIIAKCVSPTMLDCIAQAPTTQHAALVTAVVGISAAVFGLYSSTGKKWNGFTFWKKSPEVKIEEKVDNQL